MKWIKLVEVLFEEIITMVEKLIYSPGIKFVPQKAMVDLA